MFSRKDLCINTIDTCRSHTITKLIDQSGWNQICGMMFYSYMRVSDNPDEMPRRDDSEQFEDAIEPPTEPQPRTSRFRCLRRSTRPRSAEPPARGRESRRSMRDGSSQTPEPARPRLSRQGVSSTNIPRTPRRDSSSQTTRN